MLNLACTRVSKEIEAVFLKARSTLIRSPFITGIEIVHSSSVSVRAADNLVI